jgi:DNA-binding NtrC family response regulator
VHVDVRIVCATNKDLARATRDGSFRGDLYARVSELVLRCPPLRDRREDILLLLESALPKPHPPLSPDLAHHLMLHPWPFHVREVKKTAAMLALHAGTRSELDLELVRDRLAETRSLASSNDIEGEDDDSTAGGSRTPRGPAPDADALLELLRTHRGNVMRVAEATGRSPRQVRRWLTQHGIDADKYRG